MAKLVGRTRTKGNPGKKVEEKTVFRISSNSERGTIAVGKEDVTLNLGSSRTIRRNYVVGFSKVKEGALNKVVAALEYYDIFGNKERREFLLSENDFRALKKVLGK